MKKQIWLALFGLWCGLVCAKPLHLQANHPFRYEVQPGDTLWRISGLFLKEPWRWRELLQANPHVKHPRRLFPGDVLVFDQLNGQPHLRVLAGGTVRLSPKVRRETLTHEVSALPLDVIKPFLVHDRVIDQHRFSELPYVIASVDEHIGSATGDEVYVRGLSNPHIMSYGVYRAGRPFTDPDTNELLGTNAVYIGRVDLARFADISKMHISSSAREMLSGDRLMVLDDEEAMSHFYPEAPQKMVSGHIIDVLGGGVSQVGQYQVVVLDRGERNGLQAGDVLSIYRSGETVLDPISKQQKALQLPDEITGRLMIFRTFARVSYALVLDSSRPLHVFDRVKNP